FDTRSRPWWPSRLAALADQLTLGSLAPDLIDQGVEVGPLREHVPDLGLDRDGRARFDLIGRALKVLLEIGRPRAEHRAVVDRDLERAAVLDLWDAPPQRVGAERRDQLDELLHGRPLDAADDAPRPDAREVLLGVGRLCR